MYLEKERNHSHSQVVKIPLTAVQVVAWPKEPLIGSKKTVSVTSQLQDPNKTTTLSWANSMKGEVEWGILQTVVSNIPSFYLLSNTLLFSVLFHLLGDKEVIQKF